MTAIEVISKAKSQGLQLSLRGDKIFVYPCAAVTEELKQSILANREDIVAHLLRAQNADPCCPWPPVLIGQGTRTLGPLTRCVHCDRGTWVRYGKTPLCLHHALVWEKQHQTQAGRQRLSLKDREAMDILTDAILDVFPETEGWLRDWRENHPKARLC